MSTQPAIPSSLCPTCGANVSPNQSSCPACGAPLSSETFASKAKQAELREMVETSNQQMVTSGTNAAESAFGIGCSLGGMVSLVIILIAFILGWRDWTQLAVVALVAILFATGISAILSVRAKSASIRSTYEREVSPMIDRFLRANRLTHLEFSALADQMIEKDAPLRDYLTLPAVEDQAQSPVEE
jgi:ABC-type multidrug transport system fused ATPase/permease subunit